MQSQSPHVPVLYREVRDVFRRFEEGIIIDCTMGYGGHSEILLESNEKVFVIGIDRDETAIAYSKRRLERFGDRVAFRQGRFSDVLRQLLLEEKIRPKGILADIGVSSLQLDRLERGFSFQSDTLDMRMDRRQKLCAANVVNDYTQAELERVLETYGELKNAASIASAIVRNRPFYSAKELTNTLEPLLKKTKKIHPVTLVFQAIRIEVNDELGELRRLLDAIESSDIDTASVAIISFHSLEDRIVKRRFAAWAKSCICPADAMRCTCGNDHALGRIVTKKPITAQVDEIQANPRSRSAKMRVFAIER